MGIRLISLVEIRKVKMGIRNLKPVTPGSRFASRSDFSDITAKKPEKKLTVALRKKSWPK